MFISSRTIVYTSSVNPALYISAKTPDSLNFLVNSLKYPNNSVLSLHDGWTEAIYESFLQNLPQAYAKEVLPVPEIPCKITNLVEAIADKNISIIFLE